MVRSLEMRRERIVHKLAHVNRAITATEKRLAEILVRMAELKQVKARAA